MVCEGTFEALSCQLTPFLSIGHRSIAKSNRAKCWLLPKEEEVVLGFALEIAS